MGTTKNNNNNSNNKKSDICREERVSRVPEGNIRIRRRSLFRLRGVNSGGVIIGGVAIGGVTSGFRQQRRCTEAASVTPSPLVFRPARSHDSRRRRRRRRRCRQTMLFPTSP